MSSSSYNRTHHPSRKLSHMTGLRGSNLVDVEVFANCVSWLIQLPREYARVPPTAPQLEMLGQSV